MSCNITTGQFCVLRLKFVFFHFPPFLSPSIPPFLSRGIILIKHFILDLPLLLLSDVIQAKRSKKNDVIVRLKVMLQNFFVQLDVNCFVLIQLAAIAAAVAAVAADAADDAAAAAATDDDAAADAAADAADDGAAEAADIESACNLEALSSTDSKILITLIKAKVRKFKVKVRSTLHWQLKM